MTDKVVTPKEQAATLVNKFVDATDQFLGHNETISIAKKCALIAVEGILDISYFEDDKMSEDDSLYKNYWTSVRDEINSI